MMGSLNGSKNAMVSSAGTMSPSLAMISAPFLISMTWGCAMSSSRFGQEADVADLGGADRFSLALDHRLGSVLEKPLAVLYEHLVALLQLVVARILCTVMCPCA